VLNAERTLEPLPLVGVFRALDAAFRSRRDRRSRWSVDPVTVPQICGAAGLMNSATLICKFNTEFCVMKP